MNKSKAIRLYCMDCAGESTKEVTLCHITDCPLWPFRMGNKPTTLAYKKRMENARRQYPEDYAEVEKLGGGSSRKTNAR